MCKLTCRNDENLIAKGDWNSFIDFWKLKKKAVFYKKSYVLKELLRIFLIYFQ